MRIPVFSKLLVGSSTVLGLVLCLSVLSSCAPAPSQPAVFNPSLANPAKTGTIAGQPGQVTIKCGTIPSVADWNTELDNVQPQTPIGGTLRVFLPPINQEPSAACMNAYYLAQIEAIRRSHYFESIVVAQEAMSNLRPDVVEDGYVIWVEAYSLVGAYGTAIRGPLMTPSQPLDKWAANMKNILKSFKDSADKKSNAIGSSTIGQSNYYGFKGREYITFSDLRQSLLDNAHLVAEGVHKVPNVSNKLLIVIPPEASVVEQWKKLTANVKIAGGANLGLISGTSTYVNLTAQAESIRKSDLFHSTVIENKDVSDVELGTYDAVMWVQVSDTSKWYVRLKGHRAQLFKTLITEDEDKWIVVVRDAIAKAQADQSLGTTK